MNGRNSLPVRKKIWVRLLFAAVVLVLGFGWGFLTWAAHAQQEAAVDQARSFAESVHQMTMAGLTGMMITGTVREREVFLDQIRESDNVASVKVLRGEAVSRQFGNGTPREMLADDDERTVMATGQPSFELITAESGQRLRAILPAVASRDYLGKDCLSCHAVSPGTVLGAVSVEISLDQARAAAADFSTRSTQAALLVLIPFGVLIWFAITRSVTWPLAELTQGLWRIAEGDIEADHRLPARRPDETGEAARAFNQVMARTLTLLQAQRIYQTVFDHSVEAITVTDEHGIIEAVNPAFERTTGFAASDAVGTSLSLLKPGRHGDEFYHDFWNTLVASGRWVGEIWNRRKDGSIYSESLSMVAVHDSSGRVERYIGMFSDITARKLQQERMEFRAFHDDLTGLPNRASFFERLSHAVALAKRPGHAAPAVMFLDLDKFKSINDTLGHDAGDEVLKEFAMRLQGCLRESDTVARIGGDEFTVLLAETSAPELLEQVANKIFAALAEPMTTGGKTFGLNASIGIAAFPANGDTPSALLKSADEALYEAKGGGRGGYRFAGSTRAAVERGGAEAP